MKIAITGKGGVGKTIMVGLMARVFRDMGDRVLAVDADPDMNLASVLGVPESEHPTPIVELKELIAERTGASSGMSSPLFKLNPRVDDIPDSYCTEFEGLKLIVMGSIKGGGKGCACPENAFLRQLMSHLLLSRNEVVLVDMEAGIEHLGRGTARGVDRMLAVAEPSLTSIETVIRIKKLALDIGIQDFSVIGNKIRSEEEERFLRESLKDITLAGFLAYSDEIRKIDTGRASALSIGGEPVEQLGEIVNKWI